MSIEEVPAEGHDLSKTRAGELFLEHSGVLMSVFSRDLQEQDALDLFQSLYLNVTMKGIPENIENVKGYLIKAASNDIVDFKRKSATQRKNVHNYSQYVNSFRPDNDPAKQLMRFDLLMKAFETIGKHLSPSVNQVFIQKFQHNLNHREIAEKLNLTLGTVDRYLSVGTKQIRELYDQFLGDFDEKT